MLFHSQAFILLFLPVAVAAYYAVAGSTAAREWVMIAASCVFYAWWDVRFLPLLIGEVLAGWLCAEIFFRTGRRWVLGAGLALHLLLLGIFKYYDFFAGVIGTLMGLDVPPSGIVLPIGISFFTFQIVSYLVDARRCVVPRYGLRRFAVVILLFPHLIAGPIVRHAELVPQLDADPRREGLDQRLATGLTLFVLGVALKVFLADKLAPIADPVFAAAGSSTPAFSDGWVAALAFALQIYFDFSAYSEMAIGLALIFGLSFPLNFNTPYRATSLRDFWRRWHMSLSRFLRDYLYVPLGGSREGAGRFVLATLATMGLCGLWHGAGWTFVIWGLLHGIGLIVCRWWQTRGYGLPASLGWLLTFLFAVVAFVPFRAPDLTIAASMLSGMTGGGGIGAAPAFKPTALLALALGLAVVQRPNPEIVATYLKPNRAVACLTAFVAIVSILEVGRGQPSSFIYFQF